MNDTLDVLNSTLTSTLRFWRGTNARAAAKQPQKHLQLYEFEACPFCRLVREALTELDLDALIYPTPHGGKRFRPKVAEARRQAAVPVPGRPQQRRVDVRVGGHHRLPVPALRRSRRARATAASARRLLLSACRHPARACRQPRPPVEGAEAATRALQFRIEPLLAARARTALGTRAAVPAAQHRQGSLAGPRPAGAPGDPVSGPAGGGPQSHRTARASRQGAGALAGGSRTPAPRCSSRRRSATTCWTPTQGSPLVLWPAGDGRAPPTTPPRRRKAAVPTC